ncbi:MAG: hypothetical protein ACFE89_10560 [Candidatus Hodarchaeota archaeon]
MSYSESSNHSVEKFDCFFVVLGAILGILSFMLIGVPLWLATGYPDYLRISFFLGVLLGVIAATLFAYLKKRRY